MEEIKQLESFLAFLRNSDQRYKLAVDDKAIADLETQDILHRLELYSDKYHEKAKLAKILTEVRQKRRDAKVTQELLEPIVKWYKDNKATVKSLERLLGTLRITVENQEKRVYTPKTDILEEVIKE